MDRDFSRSDMGMNRPFGDSYGGVCVFFCVCESERESVSVCSVCVSVHAACVRVCVCVRACFCACSVRACFCACSVRVCFCACSVRACVCVCVMLTLFSVPSGGGYAGMGNAGMGPMCSGLGHSSHALTLKITFIYIHS